MNDFPKTGQIFPIRCIGGGIRTDPISFEVVAKITMTFWVKCTSYWIQYKVN